MGVFRFVSSVFGPVVAILSTAAFADCDRNAVQLRGDWGTARFNVEIADNAILHQQGLMGRETMPTSSGMLFVYHHEGLRHFWMKNTLIPLDMIFLDEHGVVVSVHHNAKPLDLTSISSLFPTRYVLEINGGLSKSLGIQAGSELRHPAVLQHTAAWPCSD